MANGVWTNVPILFETDGVEGDSIRLVAETPGEVILNGSSRLSIAGNYLVVDGLRFDGGSTNESYVIQFRKNSSKHANHSRLTNSAIIDYNPTNVNTDYKWVSLYGTHNRVDHSFFRGKTHSGTTLVVWLNDPPDDQPNFHRIDHNYFGHRPPLGFNGGETIRIGTSSRSMQDSNTLVEHNYFERCNGETEIISNKSGKNVFRHNTFYESAGTLTLRHGNEARIEGNFFIGNNQKDTGGVRVIGEDHVIVNNYFQDLDGSGFRAPLPIMNGVPNSPLNRYFQVKRAIIAFNTFVGNRNGFVLGLGSDSERTLPPEDVVIANNLVMAGSDEDIIDFEDAPINLTWEGNIMFGSDVGVEDAGIMEVDPMLQQDDMGIWRPNESGAAIDMAVGDYAWLEQDMDGHPRGDNLDIGADEFSPNPPIYRPLTAADTGPDWLAAVLTSTEQRETVAEALGLHNYPNPFLDKTTIAFKLQEVATVNLKIYNLLGQQVEAVFEGVLSQGEHRFSFHKGGLVSGLYFYVLQVDAESFKKGMVVI